MINEVGRVYPQLSNAPIREAVLDFMVQPQLEIEERHLNELKSLLGERYNNPETIAMKSFGFSFNFNEGVGSAIVADETPVEGFIFRDDASGYIVQIRRDRIVISKLKPYENFVKFKNEAFEVFEKACKMFSVKRVNRIGLRYLNDIVMQRDRGWYLRRDTMHTSTDMKLASTHHRYDYIKSDANQGAVLQVAEGTISDEDKPHLIIDIDVFSLESTQVDERALISVVLDRLDNFKNEIFFDVISDQYHKECT